MVWTRDWPGNELRIEELNKTFMKWKGAIPGLLNKNVQQFVIKNWDKNEEYPDFLGETYNYICEDAIEAIIADDIGQFECDYKSLSELFLLYQEYVRKDFVQNQERYRIEFAYYMATSPIIEWAQIGALAIIWGECNQNPKWKECVDKCVRQTIVNDNNGKSLARTLIQYIQDRRKFMWGIGGDRDVLETEWDLRVSNAIRQLDDFSNQSGMYFMPRGDNMSVRQMCYRDIIDMGEINYVEDLFWILCINPLLPKESRFHSLYSWERLNEQLANE